MTVPTPIVFSRRTVHRFSSFSLAGGLEGFPMRASSQSLLISSRVVWSTLERAHRTSTL